jgi:hypothetical protein
MGWVPVCTQAVCSGIPLTSNDRHVPGLTRPGYVQRLGQQGNQVLHPVCDRRQDHDADVVILQILPVLQVLVGRQENVEGRGGSAQQFSVRVSGPATIEHGLHRDLTQMTRKRPR